MIQLECLAASWVIKQCHQFLEGLPGFELITNNHPLVTILNDYFLDNLTNRGSCGFVSRWRGTSLLPLEIATSKLTHSLARPFFT